MMLSLHQLNILCTTKLHGSDETLLATPGFGAWPARQAAPAGSPGSWLTTGAACSGLPGGCFAPPRFQAPGAVSVARMLSCLLAALDCFLEAVPLAPLPAAVPACEPLPDLPGAANFWLSRVKHSCRDFL